MCDEYMPVNLGFKFNSDFNRWYREDLTLYLYKIDKMDLYKPLWELKTLSDEGLFCGDVDEMNNFLISYIREYKLNIIDDNN